MCPKYIGNKELFGKLTEEDRRQIDKERRLQDTQEWIKIMADLQKNIADLFACDKEAKQLNDDARLKRELQMHLYQFMDHIKAYDCAYNYLAIYKYIPDKLKKHTLTFLNKFYELYSDGFKGNRKHCESAVMAMIDYYNEDASGNAKCALGKRYDQKLRDIDRNIHLLNKIQRESKFEKTINSSYGEGLLQ